MFDSDLNNFILLAKLGSLSSVSRKTGQDIGNLSRSLSRLEKRRSSLLFTRHKTGVELTEEGKKLFQALLLAQESFDHSIQKPQSTIIRIGFSSAVGFGYFSEVFLSCLLKNKFIPQFTILPSIELFELLKTRKLDLILAPRSPKFPGIIVKPISLDRLVLCSQNGKMQRTLLVSSQMFEFEKILSKLNYERKWIVDDYFVLGKLLSEQTELMGIIPESLLSIYPKLKSLDQMKMEGKITGISWSGSIGVKLLKEIKN